MRVAYLLIPTSLYDYRYIGILQGFHMIQATYLRSEVSKCMFDLFSDLPAFGIICLCQFSLRIIRHHHLLQVIAM